MNADVMKQIIRVIRNEAECRETNLPKHPDAADDQWLLVDEPFLRELCLMVLLSLHHETERELVHLAARKADGVKPTISHDEYRQNVLRERNALRRRAKRDQYNLKDDERKSADDKREGWRKLYDKLGVRSSDGKKDIVPDLETLRCLANSYKHDPFGEPSAQLLEMLNLPPRRQLSSQSRDSAVYYGSLWESDLLREGLATSIGLAKEADFCDIASRLIEIVSEFLRDLRSRTVLMRVEGLVSLENFAR